MNISMLHIELHMRRTRNRYFPKSFVDLILKEVVLCHARAESFQDLFFFEARE